MITRHRWQDAEGMRHAISRDEYPLPPRPGEQVETLCGLIAVLSEEDFPSLPSYRRLKKTCFACDAEWRARENLRPVP